MPFMKEDTTAIPAANTAPSYNPEPKEYALSEQFAAFFDQENTIDAVADGIKAKWREGISGELYQEGYDVFDNLKGYEPWADRFRDVQTPYAAQVIREKIDEEQKNKEIMQYSNPLVGLAAGILDPINLLPLGGIKRARTLGASALRTGGSAAAYGLGAGVAQEAILQASQETRTAEESAVNVAGMTLLSGIFGGVAGAARHGLDFKALEGLARDVDVDLKRSDTGSVGAARVADATTLDQEGFADAFGLEKFLKFQDPVMSMVNSPAKSSRQLVEKLAEVNAWKQKNKDGIAMEIPVENMVKQTVAAVGDFTAGLNDAFERYRTGTGGGIIKRTTITARDTFQPAARGDKLTRAEFNQEVSKAARRDDQHEIPEVAEAAQAWRTKIAEPLAKRAQAVGLLPEDLEPKFAASYLNRVWDTPLISSKPAAFDAMNIKHFKGERDKAQARIADWDWEVTRAKQILKDTKMEQRRAIAGVKQEKDTAREKLAVTDSRHRAAVATMKRDETVLKRNTQRAKDFKPYGVDDQEERKFLGGLLRDLKRGHGKITPDSLATFVRKKGGVKDARKVDNGTADAFGETSRGSGNGDIKASGITQQTTGIVNNKGGMGADEMARLATDAGYFTQEPDANGFIAALVDDVNGRKTYRMADEDLLAYDEYLRDFTHQLEKSGYDINKMTPEELDFSIKSAGDEAAYYRMSTPATRARYREVLYHEKRARERLGKTREYADDLEKKLVDAGEAYRRAKEAQGEALPRIMERKKAIRGIENDVASLKESLEKDKWYAGFEDDEFPQVAATLRNRIIGTPGGRLIYDYQIGEARTGGGGQVGVRGSLKGKVYNLPDITAEPWLKNDIEELTHALTRSMAVDISLVERFPDQPDILGDMMESRMAITDEYDGLIAKNPDQAHALQQAKEKDIRHMLALRDRLRGTYKLPDDYAGFWQRAGRVAMQVNFLRLLGGMTIGALPDIGRPVMVHGIQRVFGDGVMGMVKNRKEFVVAARQVKESGTAWDMVLNTAVHAANDLNDVPDIGMKIEKWLSRRSAEFSTITLMNPWNTALKQFSGVVTQNRILGTINELAEGRLGGNDRTWLAANFIDKRMAQKIKGQFERYGETHGEGAGQVMIPNAREWDDLEAQNAFRAAVRKSVDGTIITKGIDLPLSFSNPIGKVILQFKSFAFASVQRVLLSGLQQRDMATLNGIILMVSLGMVSTAAKDSLAGRELSDDPRQWILDGIDRSGITGWFMDANNIMEKFTGGVGLSALTRDGGGMSRYASRSAPDAMLGPTFGLATNIALALSALGGGEAKESDVHEFRKMMPYQNHFLLGRLFDAAEAGVNSALGIPTKN